MAMGNREAEVAMPDITMCDNAKCPLSSKCYRFTATPDPRWQSQAHYGPSEDGECREFIEARSMSQRRRLGVQMRRRRKNEL